MNERREKGSSAGAFIVGAAIGAVAALMLAPFSGRKMRRVSKEKGQEALNKAKDKYSKAENTLNRAADKTRGYFNKTRETVADKVDEVEAGVRGKAEKATDDLEEAADVLEEEADQKL
jgi:gas vesicle protein